jgi:hypothetical protein
MLKKTIETYNHGKIMFKTKNNIEYSVICGPITKLSQMKLILRPALQFEFDMPDLEESILH